MSSLIIIIYLLTHLVWLPKYKIISLRLILYFSFKIFHTIWCIFDMHKYLFDCFPLIWLWLEVVLNVHNLLERDYIKHDNMRISQNVAFVLMCRTGNLVKNCLNSFIFSTVPYTWNPICICILLAYKIAWQFATKPLGFGKSLFLCG